MNKKILIVAALLMVVCVSGAFAWAIGIQGGGGVNAGGGAAITFKLDQLPLVFAADFAGNSNYFAIGVTGDYWFIGNPTIVDTPIGPFGWFIGGGVGVAFRFWDNDSYNKDDHGGFGIRVAGRLPIGLNMMIGAGPVEIEPYIQAVPQIGVWMIDDFGLYWDVDFNVGLRFHF
ncbi:MAG: hypothetical protein IKK79_04070 [Spirochaetaceae bacterium]|nr:hypothetical protein [Spirochaetaceae bacterium]